uniref:Uncharacterized protein n=1 Tax=Onchocerca volvulus TaxID=6282 RepID=A0A8R1TYI0_ONCVO
MSSAGHIVFVLILSAIVQFQLAQAKAIESNKIFKKIDWNFTLPIEAIIPNIVPEKLREYISDKYKASFLVT